MFTGLVIALVVQCPLLDPNHTCDLPGGPLKPEQVIMWSRDDDAWPCDGSVWWEVLGPSGEWGKFYCTQWQDDAGETVTSCPRGVPPIRFETMYAGGSVAVTVKACNEFGCSLTCTRVYEWPSVCEFSDRAGMLACFGVVE